MTNAAEEQWPQVMAADEAAWYEAHGLFPGADVQSWAHRLAQDMFRAGMKAENEFTEAWARKAVDLHRENLQLRDENAALRGPERG